MKKGHIPSVGCGEGSAARLRGLEAAQRAISEMIAEARKACEPYGPRQGRPLSWWRGQFEGLVCAKAMLALAEFPDQPDNAAQIEKLLKPNADVLARGESATPTTPKPL